MTPHAVSWGRYRIVLSRIMLDIRLFSEVKHVI